MNRRSTPTRDTKLPFALEQKILELLGLEGLNETNWRRHEPRLEQLGRDMYCLARDFAGRQPSEARYQDAYFAYNFPTNFMKAQLVAREIAFFHPELFSRPAGIDILDIGCGEGAGLFGFSDYIRGQSQGLLSLVGVDTSRSMLERASHLGEWLGERDKNLHTRFRHHDFASGRLRRPDQRYDIVIFANSLIELVPEASIPADFTEGVLEFLSDNGILVVIEPALKKSSRRLMAWRDRITSSSEASVLLPCLHRSACPLLDIRGCSEWCHERSMWQPPYYLDLLNRRLHREVDRLKFSYLVIARPGLTRSGADGYRVINGPFKEKGRKRCFLCTPDGQVELVRLNRNQSVPNQGFDAVNRGATVQVEDFVVRRSHFWEVTDKTRVKVLLG